MYVQCYFYRRSWSCNVHPFATPGSTCSHVFSYIANTTANCCTRLVLPHHASLPRRYSFTSYPLAWMSEYVVASLLLPAPRAQNKTMIATSACLIRPWGVMAVSVANSTQKSVETVGWCLPRVRPLLAQWEEYWHRQHGYREKSECLWDLREMRKFQGKLRDQMDGWWIRVGSTHLAGVEFDLELCKDIGGGKDVLVCTTVPISWYPSVVPVR